MSTGITPNQLVGGDVVSILRTTVELTNAQIKASPGGISGEGFTQLVAAPIVDPGESKAYRVIGLELISQFVAAYGNISSNAQLCAAVGSGAELSDFQLQTLSARDVAAINLPVTTLLTNTAKHTIHLPRRFSIEDIGGGNLVGNVSAQPLSVIANKPIVLACFNAGGNFTGGHDDNILIASVLYTVSDA